jgi:hypothetical protein
MGLFGLEKTAFLTAKASNCARFSERVLEFRDLFGAPGLVAPGHMIEPSFDGFRVRAHPDI